MRESEQLNVSESAPKDPIQEKAGDSSIREFLDNNLGLKKIYDERSTEDEIVVNDSGQIVSDRQVYEDTPRMRSLVELANAIRQSLPKFQEGYVRLWRGNRRDEIGHNPSYTNSLEGIALPFLRDYGGVLSYIDIPQEEIEKYLRTGAVAKDSEFILPSEVVKNATIVGFSPEEAEEIKRKAKPLSDAQEDRWTSVGV
jgi:hypothetical protein